MENVGIFYGLLNILRPFWYILWPFSNSVVICLIFLHFGTLRQEKSGNPVLESNVLAYSPCCRAIQGPFESYVLLSKSEG
jgi:hypothetical protein